MQGRSPWQDPPVRVLETQTEGSKGLKARSCRAWPGPEQQGLLRTGTFLCAASDANTEWGGADWQQLETILTSGQEKLAWGGGRWHTARPRDDDEDAGQERGKESKEKMDLWKILMWENMGLEQQV